MTPSPYRTALVIAGSDPIAGAGIQADLKSCLAFGVYATTVITAVTAQNTLGVKTFQAVPPSLLEAQLEAVLEDVPPQAVKIGMIPDAESVRIIAEALKRYDAPHIVVDPVLVATSGDSLTGGDTREALINRLFPLAEVVTPNLHEAEALSGQPVSSPALIKEAARTIISGGCRSVLIKGGHGEGDTLTDTLFIRDSEPVSISHPRIDSPNTHGTGCSLSSAIAANLALGHPLQDAVRRADLWLEGAIATGAHRSLGKGHGPVNHLYNPTSHFA